MGGSLLYVDKVVGKKFRLRQVSALAIFLLYYEFDAHNYLSFLRSYKSISPKIENDLCLPQ